jgi:hypothetical protein
MTTLEVAKSALKAPKAKIAVYYMSISDSEVISTTGEQWIAISLP